MHTHTHLHQALIELAPTHQERASILDVTPRMVMLYLDGTHTPSLRVIERSEKLVSALVLDLQELLPNFITETAA